MYTRQKPASFFSMGTSSPPGQLPQTDTACAAGANRVNCQPASPWGPADGWAPIQR